jgi:hypothetical protein
MTHPEVMPGPTLELVREHKIHELLPGGSADDRHEASGVCFREGYFYVIFDNSPHIARLERSLTVGHPANILLRQRGESAGFEDIAYQEYRRRYLIIIEALLDRSGIYRPNIEEYDDDFRYQGSRWVDFGLAGENKGMEGLACFRRDDQPYVLGLCEGNKCKAGKRGRVPGGGRIQVFSRGEVQWDHVDTIKLPKAVQFVDYASLDVRGERVAVVSQVTSALWIGQLREDRWSFVDDGQIYWFPRDQAGQTLYCNIEGVSWVTPHQIVVVSDRRKPRTQAKRCRAKDQSIHLFDIPA